MNIINFKNVKMISEAQQTIENVFRSEHIKEKPYFIKKSGYWHVKFKNGEKVETKDLVTIQNKIDLLNGEKID